MKSKTFTTIVAGLFATLGFIILTGFTNSTAQGDFEESTPSPSGRPLLVLESYSTGSYGVRPGQDFNLHFRLGNEGWSKARNIKVISSGADFIPRGNGGLIYAGVIDVGASTAYDQPLAANSALPENSFGSLTLQVQYSDEVGANYSETFTLGIPITSKPKSTSAPVFATTPTPTPTPVPKPQLIIQSYQTDVTELKPGTRFTLSMEVHNVGGNEAKRITMIVGGGTNTGGFNGDEDAPKDGGAGLSGAGGDFSAFAPIDSSNVKFIGDLVSGETLFATQSLIVNSGVKSGAYTLRVTFVYQDDKGVSLTDDQVVTLVVSGRPILDIGFYRPLDPIFVGMPAPLPLQIMNLDRNSLILSKMEVTAGSAYLENNTAFVGYLDPGGYFTLDPMIIAEHAGPTSIVVRVEYLDDFNHTQSILKEFLIEVGEAPIFEPPPGEIPPDVGPEPPVSETTWQKVIRFVKGIFGLDSGQQLIGSPGEPVDGPPPMDGPSIRLPEAAG